MNRPYLKIKEDWKTNKHNYWLDNIFLLLYRYGNYFQQSIQAKKTFRKRIILKLIKIPYKFMSHCYGCFIPFKTPIGNRVEFRHSFHGIFISQLAEIGDDVIIFHHVTIGSNLDSGKKKGAPIIGNNVLIGCGACLIGDIKIGDNVKIGANTTVTQDIPDNATVVGAKPEIIIKTES